MATTFHDLCTVLATLKTQETMNRQFKVAFYLRSGYKTKDGKMPVLVRLYLNNERMTLGSAGVNVNPAQWDAKAESKAECQRL